MGPELDLSELAVLRPIRTAEASGTAAATARPGSDGQDAAADGCVTPTSAVSSVPQRQQGGGVDVDDDGCVTPTSAVSSVPPQQDGGADVDGAGCVTPTSAANVLRPATVCPPAPRKPARSPPAKRKRCSCKPPPRRSFFPVPHDLGSVFVPRALGAAPGSPASSSSPASKKIRVNAVG
ncbi:hypothetical protein ACP70R_044069 [Stipagrostis hirtigluma subsp. patula]